MGIEHLASGYQLLEGPVWDPAGELLFTDAELGGVYAIRDGAIRTVVKNRRGIGGLALHERGGVIVSGRNLAYKGPDDAPTVVLIENDFAVSGLVGFSDITTDRHGRIYAGALGTRPDSAGKVARGGALFLVDLDGSSRRIIPAPEVKHTNGMGFSPDGRTLYYADSGDRAVFRHDVAPSGEVSGKALFVELRSGVPDGLAVGADGSVWIAEAFAGGVLACNPDGSVRQRIAMPVPLVTNVCFGGADLCDLYITTGSLDPQVRGGNVYRVRAPVAGLAVAKARTALPGVDAGSQRAVQMPR